MKRTNFTLLRFVSNACKRMASGLMAGFIVVLAVEIGAAQSNPLPALKNKADALVIIDNELAAVEAEIRLLSGQINQPTPAAERLHVLYTSYHRLKELLEDFDMENAVAQIYPITNQKSTIQPQNATMTMGYYERKWPAEFTEIVNKLKL